MADLRRGHLLPAIEAVMAFLDENHPPLKFPKDLGREEQEHASWLRGGTSPSGVKFAEPKQAFYYVGAKYLSAEFGGPQRVVWVPPPRGGESFAEPDSVGYHVDPDPEDPAQEPDPALDNPGRDDREPLPEFGREAPREVGHAGTGSRAFRRIASRIVPVTVDLWCNDYDDLDILINWVVAGVKLWNAGAPELLGHQSVSEGGEVEDEIVDRGLRYQLTATFAFPMVAPPRRAEYRGATRVRPSFRSRPPGYGRVL